MSSIKSPGDVDQQRRRFMAGAVMTLGAAQLGIFRVASAAPPEPTTPSATGATFGPLKQIHAGLLEIGYAEAGPANGPVVILLHGWPYDIHSYVEVAPVLASAGYRVIIPYLRGYGTTRFVSAATFRNGQQSVMAVDTLAMMDALQIEKAIVAGFDWGARTADIMAALHPERCKGLVSVSGYLITNLNDNMKPLPPAAELAWWYQYYFATDRGRAGYYENWHDFNKLIWKNASPKWDFDDGTYERTATAFNNPDHVDIVVHNYRWRLSIAKGEERYDDLERKLARSPVITVPTITIASDFDGAAANGAAYRGKFSGKYAHRVFEGIGHNVPQEAPQAFAKAILDLDRA